MQPKELREARRGRRTRFPALLGSLALAAVASSPVHAEPLRWIIVGGGAEPASTQLSLEQDCLLAQETFTGPGKTLFAGGAQTYGVQVLRHDSSGDPLVLLLGEILDPRDGRYARYRRVHIAADEPAIPVRLRATLAEASSAGTAPLLVFVATHGERGATRRENHVLLWGGFRFSAEDFAAAVDGSDRPVVLINAACYSGGFAEIAFAAADPERDAPEELRCGLFATTHDEISSGCDPSPERRADEGYGRFLLHALRRERPDGGQLPREQIDFDGDGRVSLLEAHARARIATTSFDIPTTTSERWLRERAPSDGATRSFSFPEEEAVIRALAQRLEVKDRRAARRKHELLRTRFRYESDKLAALEEKLDEAAADLRIALLERWPVLDDPWHPDFPDTFDRRRSAIIDFLDQSQLASDYRRLRDVADGAGLRIDELRAQLAVAKRLTRAYRTLDLARRLRARGGGDWEAYARLLECERSVVTK